MSTDGPSTRKRRYDGSGRQRDAAERKERIIDAAHARFLRDGYGETSIEQIARDAGTSAQTVYAAFGSKAGILKRVVDVAVAGDHEDVPLIDRPELRALFEAPDPRDRLRLAVEAAAHTHVRSARLIALAHSLAGGDAAVRELVDELDRQVRIDAERFLRAADDHLRRDLPMTRLVDITMQITGALGWHHLVNERGWTPEEWQAWALDAMEHLVLAP